MSESNWEEFSTVTVAPPQRVHRWNDFGSETLCKLTVDPQDRDAFNARLSRIEFGPLGLIRMKSTGATAYGESGVGNWAAVDRDALLLIVPERGSSQFRQDHLETELRPGDLLIRDLSASWVHACRDPMDMLMVKIPYSALLSRVEDPTRLLGTVLPAKRPAVAMAVDVVRAVDRTLLASPDEELHGALSDLVLDSVRMLYNSTAGMPDWQIGRQQRVVVRRDAKTYILRHLDDPDLTVAQVADAIGVSQRRLQRAFIEGNETPRQFILEKRLDRAARDLSRGTGHSRGSILEIALAAGFSDASHFSRSFSRRYGISPRAYRGTPPQ